MAKTKASSGRRDPARRTRGYNLSLGKAPVLFRLKSAEKISPTEQIKGTMPLRMPRIAGRLLMCLFAASLATSVHPVLAQQNNDKPTPADQQQSTASRDAAAKVARFLEAQRRLNGPAGNPECVDLGTKALNRLYGDDIDTAFRHLDLYDRFGCPGGHVQAAYRCLLLHPITPDKKPDDPKATVLDGTVDACWVNPALPVSDASTTLPGSPPAATPNQAAAPAPTPNPKN
jgi:hypothetical protein